MRRRRPGSVPPASSSSQPPANPAAVWATLPDEHRRKTLQTLSRIVAQQLQTTRSPQEVSHEDG